MLEEYSAFLYNKLRTQDFEMAIGHPEDIEKYLPEKEVTSWVHTVWRFAKTIK